MKLRWREGGGEAVLALHNGGRAYILIDSDAKIYALLYEGRSLEVASLEEGKAYVDRELENYLERLYARDKDEGQIKLVRAWYETMPPASGRRRPAANHDLRHTPALADQGS
jgi:hypothetical protein